MEPIKLFDSELKIMDLIWKNEPISAKDLSLLAEKTIGWNKNTTYTVLKKCIEKKAALRSDPGFLCTSLIKKEQVQQQETTSLIDKFYAGSKRAFFSAFLSENNLSDEELEELKKMIDDIDSKPRF